MATFTCANGHQSTTSDYCSECGKKLSGAGVPGVIADSSTGVSAALLASAGSGTGERCPDCDTPRASPTAVFCEVCRYNFVTGQPWAPGAPAAAVSPAAAPAAPIPAPAVSAAPVSPAAASAPPIAPPAASTPLDLPGIDTLRRWEAVVAADPTLYTDPDPSIPFPAGAPERVFPLDFAENLIGRRSERRAIYPEIDMSSDNGVSSRHAVIYRESDGSLTLLDVGSTNGTQLNGKDLPAGVRSPLKDGDQIVVGCWTRITIHAVPRTGGQP